MVKRFVWIVVNSPTDIHLFDDDKHLLRSVEISYCRCRNVKIETKRDGLNYTFEVEYKAPASDSKDMPNDDTIKNATIVARLISVWDEPSHL